MSSSVSSRATVALIVLSPRTTNSCIRTTRTPRRASASQIARISSAEYSEIKVLARSSTDVGRPKQISETTTCCSTVLRDSIRFSCTRVGGVVGSGRLVARSDTDDTGIGGFFVLIGWGVAKRGLQLLVLQKIGKV